MSADPDIRLPPAAWQAANRVADGLPGREGEFFVNLARELRARLEASQYFDQIEVESIAEDAIASALALVKGRGFQ